MSDSTSGSSACLALSAWRRWFAPASGPMCGAQMVGERRVERQRSELRQERIGEVSIPFRGIETPCAPPIGSSKLFSGVSMPRKRMLPLPAT